MMSWRTKKITNASDYSVLQTRYSEAFDAIMGSAEQLVYRDLAWGNEEASKLGSTLRLCQALRSLDLSRNHISDEGVIEIIDAIIECPTLERFVLSGNRVSDAGTQHIANALPKCTKLSVLDLSFNLIGNAGAQALFDMFENGDPHPALEEMLLNDNDIGATAKRALRSVAQTKQGSDFKSYI